MAKKKSTPRKKRQSLKKKKTFKTELKKVIIGFGILLVLVIAAGIFTHFFILRQPVPKRVLPEKEKQLFIPSPHKAPPFEIFPDEATVPSESLPRPAPAPLKKPLTRMAIIIDDLGYQMKLAEKFINLDAVLTFSVLPHSPYQKHIVKLAKAKGLEVMLHLPMEPLEYPDIYSGPGTLLTSMTPDELIEQLNANLESVPYVSGVNNHMGSKMTTNADQMYQIFTVLKKRGLFFIDSRTTAESVGRPSARLFQVPFAERDVFIDHIQEADLIKKQIQCLIRIAHEKGYAIGIAHPYPLTYDLLFQELPKLKQEVQLVSASELVTIVR